MRIARELYDQLIAHARAEAPNECCGLVAASGDQVTGVHPVTNRFASPLRFELEPLEHMRAQDRIDEDGHELWALYHSHTRTAPEPSQTDINGAELLGDLVWVIVGLAEEAPDVRAWRIADGRVSPTELIVE
jgi:proteasome lid subunit RPN8/RPN11